MNYDTSRIANFQSEGAMWRNNFIPQFLVTIAANGGSFIYGMLLGWSSPAAEQIVAKEDFYFWVTKNQFAWIVGMLGLGATFSCILSGLLRSKIGTRMSIFFFGIPIIIGWVMIIMPINPAMLMIGRLLCGLAVGCYSCIVPMYVGEISTNEIRGRLLSVFQVAMNLGILFVFTIGHFANLRVLNIICGSIPVLYSVGFLALPESPKVLIQNNRNAISSLGKLRGRNHDISSEIYELKRENEETKQLNKSFADVFKTKSTRKAFVIIMFQFIFLQMSGISVISFYSTMIFTSTGIRLEPGIASIIIGVVQVLANLAAFAFVDRYGRKILLYISNTFMIVGLVGIGTFSLLRDAGSNVNHLSWLPLLSLSIFVIAFSIGLGPVTFIQFGELFLQEAKVLIAPITQTFNFLLTFAVGLAFPMLVSSIGMGATFFMFAGFCALALLFTIFVIPETKGKSIAEIQELLS